MKRLTEQQLAEWWQLSVRTLRNWRWHGKGPRYWSSPGFVDGYGLIDSSPSAVILS